MATKQPGKAPSQKSDLAQYAKLIEAEAKANKAFASVDRIFSADAIPTLSLKKRRKIRTKTSEAAADGADEASLAKLGKAMSLKLMTKVADAPAEDTLVMFLVERGTYFTAKNPDELMDKYEALHPNEWGWVTDIVRGTDDHEGAGRP